VPEQKAKYIQQIWAIVANSVAFR